MAESILKIHTQNGDVPVGYPGLADKPIADKTLSEEGAFADSKAVGDKFKEVKAETDSLKEDLVNVADAIEKGFDYRLVLNSMEIGSVHPTDGSLVSNSKIARTSKPVHVTDTAKIYFDDAAYKGQLYKYTSSELSSYTGIYATFTNSMTIDEGWYMFICNDFTAVEIVNPQKYGDALSIYVGKNNIRDDINSAKRFDGLSVDGQKTYGAVKTNHAIESSDIAIVFDSNSSPMTNGYRLTSAGKPYAQIGYSISEDYIPVSGDSIRISCAMDNQYTTVAYFNSNKKNLGIKLSDVAFSEIVDKMPIGTKYIRICVKNGYRQIASAKTEVNMYRVSWIDKSISDIANGISFGDSIMAQDKKAFAYANPQYNTDKIGQICKGFQTILEENFGVKIAQNYAVGGSDIRAQREVIESKSFETFDFVMISTGTNDYSNSVPVGFIQTSKNASHDVNTFIGAYCHTIDYILQSNPKIKIILLTPIHRDTTWRNGGVEDFDTFATDIYCANNVSAKLIDYRNAVIEIGKNYGITVCDLYAESGINIKNLPVYSFEGVHLTNEGYAHLAPALCSTFGKIC